MNDIDARAFHHLRQAAQAYGQKAPAALVRDYATTALVAEGRDPDMAADAVERALIAVEGDA